LESAFRKVKMEFRYQKILLKAVQQVHSLMLLPGPRLGCSLSSLLPNRPQIQVLPTGDHPPQQLHVAIGSRPVKRDSPKSVWGVDVNPRVPEQDRNAWEIPGKEGDEKWPVPVVVSHVNVNGGVRQEQLEDGVVPVEGGGVER